VALEVGCLPSKCKALSSNPNIDKTKKTTKKIEVLRKRLK
jgi:hypothetical protein